MWAIVISHGVQIVIHHGISLLLVYTKKLIQKNSRKHIHANLTTFRSLLILLRPGMSIYIQTLHIKIDHVTLSILYIPIFTLFRQSFSNVESFSLSFDRFIWFGSMFIWKTSFMYDTLALLVLCHTNILHAWKWFSDFICVGCIQPNS